MRAAHAGEHIIIYGNHYLTMSFPYNDKKVRKPPSRHISKADDHENENSAPPSSSNKPNAQSSSSNSEAAKSDIKAPTATPTSRTSSTPHLAPASPPRGSSPTPNRNPTPASPAADSLTGVRLGVRLDDGSPCISPAASDVSIVVSRASGGGASAGVDAKTPTPAPTATKTPTPAPTFTSTTAWKDLSRPSSSWLLGAAYSPEGLGLGLGSPNQGLGLGNPNEGDRDGALEGLCGDAIDVDAPNPKAHLWAAARGVAVLFLLCLGVLSYDSARRVRPSILG